MAATARLIAAMPGRGERILQIVPALGVCAAAVVSLPAAGAADSSCYRGEIGAAAALAGGRFEMGSERHYPEEAPVAVVRVAPFDIDRHEVTNAQFERFVDATGYVTSAERATELGFQRNGSAVFRDGRWAFVPGANWRHPEGTGSSIDGRERHPVVQVSLEDARAYAEWAGRALPTEAQWEYAARGGRPRAEFAWGDELRPGDRYMANVWQGRFPYADTAGDGHAGRAEIGCFAANGYGLHDMIGNVWEWTADPYYPRRRAAARDGRSDAGTGYDPRQPGVPVGVIKGGSFLCAENFCRRYRPAARHPQDTQLGTNHLGFRTVGRGRSR